MKRLTLTLPDDVYAQLRRSARASFGAEASPERAAQVILERAARELGEIDARFADAAREIDRILAASSAGGPANG